MSGFERIPLTRARLLRELGVGPEWRLRGADESTVTVADEAEVASAPIAESSVESPDPQRARDTMPQRVAPAPSVVAPAIGGDGAIAGMGWPQLKDTVAGCEACGLCRTRKNTVFGVGDEQAEWLIVGEAPGAEEDARGEPFVGQAGRLLDNMLASIGLARGENVYIANVLKCRPPNNRNPAPTEVAQCSPFLRRQVALLQPRLVLAMGRFAVQTLLETDASISSLRGKVHRYAGLPLVATYHPAYLLRTLGDKAKAWEDLLLARRTMANLPPRQRTP